MIQYYIFTNHRQKGPYSLNEIIKQIKADTLVWHDGLPGWQKAETLPELKAALPAMATPLKNTCSYPPPVTAGEEYQFYQSNEATKGPGILKVSVFTFFGLMLFVSVVAFTNYHKGSRMQNFKVRGAATEQQRITTEKRIEQVNGQLLAAYSNLEQAQRQLDDATAYKALRSRTKRQAEVASAEKAVALCEKKIKALEAEMKEINPWWVK